MLLPFLWVLSLHSVAKRRQAFLIKYPFISFSIALNTGSVKEFNVNKNNELFLQCAAKLIAATHEKFPLPAHLDMQTLLGKEYDFWNEGGIPPDIEYNAMKETSHRMVELGFLRICSDVPAVCWNGNQCLTSVTLGDSAFKKLFGDILDDSNIGNKIVLAVKNGLNTELPKLMSIGFVELCKLL